MPCGPLRLDESVEDSVSWLVVSPSDPSGTLSRGLSPRRVVCRGHCLVTLRRVVHQGSSPRRVVGRGRYLVALRRVVCRGRYLVARRLVEWSVGDTISWLFVE